jgi:hypothetical protein
LEIDAKPARVDWGAKATAEIEQTGLKHKTHLGFGAIGKSSAAAAWEACSLRRLEIPLLSNDSRMPVRKAGQNPIPSPSTPQFVCEKGEKAL